MVVTSLLGKKVVLGQGDSNKIPANRNPGENPEIVAVYAHSVANVLMALVAWESGDMMNVTLFASRLVTEKNQGLPLQPKPREESKEEKAQPKKNPPRS